MSRTNPVVVATPEHRRGIIDEFRGCHFDVVRRRFTENFYKDASVGICAEHTHVVGADGTAIIADAGA
jgi:hypothetical protein